MNRLGYFSILLLVAGCSSTRAGNDVAPATPVAAPVEKPSFEDALREGAQSVDDLLHNGLGRSDASTAPPGPHGSRLQELKGRQADISSELERLTARGESYFEQHEMLPPGFSEERALLIEEQKALKYEIWMETLAAIGRT